MVQIYDSVGLVRLVSATQLRIASANYHQLYQLYNSRLLISALSFEDFFLFTYVFNIIIIIA